MTAPSSCLRTTSFSDFERPMKKNSAAHMPRNATMPTTTPMITVVESLVGRSGCEDVGSGVDVSPPSLGMGWPGAYWNFAFFAASICFSRVCVLLGLIAPTMSSVVQDLGAAQ